MLWYTGWWFQRFFIFHNICDVILPIDFHIFQDGYCTTNQYSIGWPFLTPEILNIHMLSTIPWIPLPLWQYDWGLQDQYPCGNVLQVLNFILRIWSWQKKQQPVQYWMLPFITYDNIHIQNSLNIEYVTFLLMDMVESPWNTLPQTNI